jgi:hypothetical protein
MSAQQTKYTLTFNQLTKTTIDFLLTNKYITRDSNHVLQYCDGRRVLICGSPFNLQNKEDPDIARLLELSAQHNGIFNAEAFGTIHAAVVNSRLNLSTPMPYKLGIDWFVPKKVAEKLPMIQKNLNSVKSGAGDRVANDVNALLELVGDQKTSTYTPTEHDAFLTKTFGADYMQRSAAFNTVDTLSLYDFTDAEKKEFARLGYSNDFRWIANFFFLFKAVTVAHERGAVSDGVNYAAMCMYIAGRFENKTEKIPVQEAVQLLAAFDKLGWQYYARHVEYVLADMEADDWLVIGDIARHVAGVVAMCKTRFTRAAIERYVQQKCSDLVNYLIYYPDPYLENTKALTGVYFTEDELLAAQNDTCATQ